MLPGYFYFITFLDVYGLQMLTGFAVWIISKTAKQQPSTSPARVTSAAYNQSTYAGYKLCALIWRLGSWNFSGALKMDRDISRQTWSQIYDGFCGCSALPGHTEIDFWIEFAARQSTMCVSFSACTLHRLHRHHKLDDEQQRAAWVLDVWEVASDVEGMPLGPVSDGGRERVLKGSGLQRRLEASWTKVSPRSKRTSPKTVSAMCQTKKWFWKHRSWENIVFADPEVSNLWQVTGCSRCK